MRIRAALAVVAAVALYAVHAPSPLVGQTTAPAVSPSAGPIRIGPNVTPPKLLESSEPEYPAAAAAARIEGDVVLECIVDENGSIRVSRVVTSIPELDPAAIAAVGRWKYEPARLAGRAQSVYLMVRVRFRLEEERQEFDPAVARAACERIVAAAAALGEICKCEYGFVRPAHAYAYLVDVTSGGDRGTTSSVDRTLAAVQDAIPPAFREADKVVVRFPREWFEVSIRGLRECTFAFGRNEGSNAACMARIALRHRRDTIDVRTGEVEYLEGRVERVSEGVTPPVLIRRVEPAYPDLGGHPGVEGPVILECVVTDLGDVIVNQVLQTIPVLERAAIRAVEQWKYRPATRDGKPVAVYLVVRVTFELK